MSKTQRFCLVSSATRLLALLSMALNGIDFLKDLNWKGRSQVSLTDLYLMERFGSVVFILQCYISAGEIWDKKCHQSLLRNIKSNTKCLGHEKRSANYREGPLPLASLICFRGRKFIPRQQKALQKHVKKAGSPAVWSEEVWEALEGGKPGLLCCKKCFAPSQSVMH